MLVPLWQLNGWDIPIPAVTFGAISDDQTEITADLLTSLSAAGLELTEDGLNTVSERLGVGLRFVQARPVASPFALSAIPTRRPALLPSVSRRAARQQQARRAVDALALSTAPKLARILAARSAEFAEAIESADSPQEAADNIAALAAAYDPGTAADLLEAFLSAASVNAALTLD